MEHSIKHDINFLFFGIFITCNLRINSTVLPIFEFQITFPHSFHSFYLSEDCFQKSSLENNCTHYVEFYLKLLMNEIQVFVVDNALLDS